MSKEKVKPSLFVAILPFIFLIIFMLLGLSLWFSCSNSIDLGIAITCIIGHFFGLLLSRN